MVQKSGGHQLRLIVYLILFIQGFIHPKWLFGMSSISSFNMSSWEMWIHDHEVFEDPLKEIRFLVFLLKLETMDVFGWETMTDSSPIFVSIRWTWKLLICLMFFESISIMFYSFLLWTTLFLTDISSYKKFRPKKIFHKNLPQLHSKKNPPKTFFEDLDLFCANL